MAKFSRELLFAKKIAVNGGRLALKRFNNTEYSFKKPRDFVTAADTEVEKYLFKAVRRKFPRHSILSEEGDNDDGAAGTNFKWIIDPIDGTANFANGIPIFSVSVGVEKNAKPFAGAVYFPVTGELFYAEKGKGAYLNGEKIKVRTKSYPDIITLLGLSSSSEKLEKGLKVLNHFAKTTLYVHLPRATCFSLCAIAAGRVDASISPTSSAWDYAASVVILEEAGGTIASTDGKPFDLYQKDGYVAASSRELLDVLVGKVKLLWRQCF